MENKALISELDMMQSVSLRWLHVWLLAILLGFLSMLPYALHTFSPLYQGLTVQRDKDFGNYYSRLERALEGFPEEASNGITPVGSGIEGLQEAGMERGMAFLFGWTGLPAPTLSIFITGIATVLVFLLLFSLLRILEFSLPWAFSIPVMLFAVMFHVLTRVMHPGWSFVPTLLTLLAFFQWTRRPSMLLAVLSGILLGLLPHIYFWSFTFVWGVAGSFIFLAYMCAPTRIADSFTRLFVCSLTRNANGTNKRRNEETKKQSLLSIVIFGVTVLLISAPYFHHAFTLEQNALYPEIAVRASFLYQRSPESWPRTILLLAQLILFGSLFKRYKNDWSYVAVLSLLLGITLAMHQNVLHNRVLMFSSHYYPHLLIASTIAGAWVIKKLKKEIMRNPQACVIVAITTIFLVAGAYDYFPGHRFFFPTEQTFADQHLKPVIEMLRTNGTHDTVLTDAYTGRLLTSWSSDGIVYTTHSRFLFISDEELIERFCVSEMFNAEDIGHERVLSLEYNRILQSEEYQERERALIEEACVRVRKSPQEYLQKYGITHVLWNSALKSSWKIDPFALGLQEVMAGEEWVLYERITEEPRAK